MVAASAASAAPQVVRPAAVPTTTTTALKLDVISARDSTLRPPRGTDACAPYRGMHLLTPFAGLPTAPAGCPLSRNDTGAGRTSGSTTVTDIHTLATDGGATVSGPGIPAGATIVSATAGVGFELSDAATTTATGTISLSRLVPAPFTYKFIINEDNTGDSHQASPYSLDPLDHSTDGLDVCHPVTPTNPDGDVAFPAHCNWPSEHPVLSSAVVTQGDSTEWNTQLAHMISNLPAGTALHPHKYLVSVSADGFEIGGAHFSVPMTIPASATTGTITVALNPYPIPLGTIQVKVFQDAAPADGTFDETTEHGLAGFSATVSDILGQVSTDWYVNPICTEYYRAAPAGLDPSPPSATMSPTDAVAYYGLGGPGQALATAYYGGGSTDYVFTYDDYVTWGVGFGDDGSPVRVPGTGGKCLSDANGLVRIPNLGTNRYSITITPPVDLANQDRWSQTTTLEGAHDSDFWLMANDSGLDTEMVQAGEPVPWAQFGFVDTKAPNTITDTSTGGHRSEIKGTVLAAEPYVPGQGGLPGQGGANGQSGIRYPRPLDRVMIALNDFDNGDQVGFTTQNNADGTFDIKNVKDGTYLMSFWDIDQDYAFDVFNVTVNSKDTARAFAAGAAHSQAAGTLRNGNGLIPAANLTKLTALARTFPAITSTSSTCALFLFGTCLLGTQTLTFASNPGLSVGDSIVTAGFSPGSWNRTHIITATAGNSVTSIQVLFALSPTVIGSATQPALTFSAADISRTITSSTAAIPAGTRVSAFNAARTATGNWSWTATGAFTRVTGSFTLTSNDVGSVITGTGLPAGTTIATVAVGGLSGTLSANCTILPCPKTVNGFTLSQNIILTQAGSAGSGFGIQLGTAGAQTVTGSNLLTLAGSATFLPADVGATVTLSGANAGFVPAGTTIASVGPAAFRAVMSTSATGTGNAAGLTLGHGAATVAGSTLFWVAANVAPFANTDIGQSVGAAGVPADATIVCLANAAGVCQPLATSSRYVLLSVAATATAGNLSFSLLLPGPPLDLGNVPLIGWFTRITGHVFVDNNANGKRDPGEPGVPNFDVIMKNRTNDLMVSGQNVSTTEADGTYHLKEAYPAGSFNIEEFFNTRYKTSGVTYQADNDPQEHTVSTGAVDISVNPIIGQDGRVDIGVLPYDIEAAVDNNSATPCADACQGGIVATVAYDSTRNELQSRKAATEDYEPGIPGIAVDIYKPVACAGSLATNCDPTHTYQVEPDGSFTRAPLHVGDGTHAIDEVAPGNTPDPNSATYITETWHRPSSCIPRDSEGRPVVQDAIRMTTAGRTFQDCVEATMLGTTFGFADGDNPVTAADSQNVDGNYGFVPYQPGDYIVGVTIKNDPILGHPYYKVRTEDPINVFTGDAYVPQGADLSGMTFSDFLKPARADVTVPQLPAGHGLREPAMTSAPYPNATCVGDRNFVVQADNPLSPQYNPDLHNVNGSPYEGQHVASCQYKLIHVEAGSSTAPNFNLWTDVPIPSKFFGYVTDDISVSTDTRSTALGEVQGVGNVPVGLYDWTNRLLTVTDTDPNGLFEVLMPSTNSYNCPVPAGPCAGMYRFVGNDPGQPQHPNLNYNPAYRVIAANFQAWPGIFTSADTAPTRAVVQIEGPGSQFSATAVCKADVVEPQLYRVDYPYAPNPNNFNATNTQTTATINIYGLGYGATKGSVTLTNEAGAVQTLTGASLPTWNDQQVTLTMTMASFLGGAYQLHVVRSNGLSTVNGLTIHVLKSPYTTVAANRAFPLLASKTTGSTTLTLSAAALLIPGLAFSRADVGARVTGLLNQGIPANTKIVRFIDVLHVQMSNPASGSTLLLATVVPESFTARFPDVIHVGPLSTLRRVDRVPSVIGPDVAELAPNAPYNNWSETNRSNMFTPIDPSQFYFPGPIQKALNYGWDRYLNDSALVIFLAQLLPDDSRPLLYQTLGAKNRHPLVITYPRFDNNPLTGDPAIDPVTHLASFDPDDPAIGFNFNGAYYESPVLFYPVKVQGSGPGGIYDDPLGPRPLYGSVVDGQYYNAATNKPEGSSSDIPDAPVDITVDPSIFAEPYAALWETFVVFQLGAGASPVDPTFPVPLRPLASWFGYGWDGQQAPTEGEVFYVVAHNGDYAQPVAGGGYTTSYKAGIDGLTIMGGDQKGFPGNRNEAGGGRLVEAPGQTGTAPDENFVLDIQGGAIMVNAFARYLQITNNSVVANSGASGAIRIGTPQLGTDTEDGNPEGDPITGETFPTYDQQNTDLRLAYNRITANGGTSLGGSLSLFNGSERYRVDHNEFCGNFSAEYGGAISHFGLSKNGEIDHNKIYLNESVDEGAGIMIAGEPHLDPATAIPLPGVLSNGSGAVKIHDNYIAANLAGDDGGGIRFLQAGNWQADVYNNMITNNVSTHEGGGIALDDSTNVRIFNNTIAKSLTTATAVTSNGQPAPAGLSTGANSRQLQACSLALPPPGDPDHAGDRTRGRTTAGSAVFLLQAAAPAASNFTQDDVGATLVVVAPAASTGFVPVGAQIVSVAASGRSAVLSEVATTSSPATSETDSLTFRVFRACSGMPPQAASPATFSSPLLFNNVFDDNRAGNWTSIGINPGVHGISAADAYHWDMGAADGSGILSPTNSVINDVDGHGFTPDGSNSVANGAADSNAPLFTAPFDLRVSISPWRVQPRFRPTAIVGVSLPANAIGNYHLSSASGPAFNRGAASKTLAPFGSVNAPANDIDNDVRPALGGIDAGADERGIS